MLSIQCFDSSYFCFHYQFTYKHVIKQVNPNLAYTLENDGDIETTTKLLNHFDDNFEKTDAGGNDMAVFRLMSSSASFYNKIKFVSMIMSLVIVYRLPLFPTEQIFGCH